jgi:outer membrane protein OmpA-like peptidoglycan-associated protein
VSPIVLHGKAWVQGFAKNRRSQTAMKSRCCLAALAVVLPVVAGPSIALGEVMATLRKTVVTMDVPLAIPISTPLKDRFGLGAMPSLSAAVPMAPWLQLGLRLRCGFLWNGPPPSEPGLKDPGTGGLGALFVTARVRPLGKDNPSQVAGPWAEIGIGPGLTGSLVRAIGEAGLGWNFNLAGLTLGPTARYLHVVQPSDGLDSTDAKILLFGIELKIRDPQVRGEAEQAAAAATATEGAKTNDRDGDGIPDDVDKCPDDAEDKDGFEDEDGCPDPDNDGDGIPDTKDKCPNEPETVNGFQDEDGCPDEGAVVVKKDRIYLKEYLLFDTNRARVRTEGRPSLVAILNLWTQHPEWDHLIVDGHADRHGSDEYNLWLSRTRAERVRNKLIEMGFPGEKLTLRAFGRQKPRVPTETEEADRENRRVEFVIVKKVKVPAKGEPATEPVAPAPAAPDSDMQAKDTGQPAQATTPSQPPAQIEEPLEPPAQAAAPLEPPSPQEEDDEARQ